MATVKWKQFVKELRREHERGEALRREAFLRRHPHARKRAAANQKAGK
jgi:hypothetical protein